MCRMRTKKGKKKVSLYSLPHLCAGILTGANNVPV